MTKTEQTFEHLVKTASDRYALENRPKEALAYVERALLIKPTSIRALILKGDILFQLDRDEEALACYDRAIKIDPSNGEAYMEKGAHYLAQGMPEKALSLFEEAYQRRRADDGWPSELLFDRQAEALKMLGRIDEAIVTVRRGLKENPESELLGDMLEELEKEKRKANG